MRRLTQVLSHYILFVPSVRSDGYFLDRITSMSGKHRKALVHKQCGLGYLRLMTVVTNPHAFQQCQSDMTYPEVPSSDRDLPWLHIVHNLEL
jgi:hypothetical protein